MKSSDHVCRRRQQRAAAGRHRRPRTDQLCAASSGVVQMMPTVTAGRLGRRWRRRRARGSSSWCWTPCSLSSSPPSANARPTPPSTTTTPTTIPITQRRLTMLCAPLRRRCARSTFSADPARNHSMCSSDIVCVVSISSVAPFAWCSTTCTVPIRRELGETDDVDGVVDQDPLVVVGVREREREDTLLLEVRLVDPGEGTDDDRSPVHVPHLHRRVLARRAFAVVLVADRDPGDAGLAVRLRELRHRLRPIRRARRWPARRRRGQRRCSRR